MGRIIVQSSFRLSQSPVTASAHCLELLVIDLVSRSFRQRLKRAEKVGNHIERQILGTEFFKLDNRQLRSVARTCECLDRVHHRHLETLIPPPL